MSPPHTASSRGPRPINMNMDNLNIPTFTFGSVSPASSTSTTASSTISNPFSTTTDQAPGYISPSVSLNISTSMPKSPSMKSPISMKSPTHLHSPHDLPIQKAHAGELEQFVTSHKPVIIDIRSFNHYMNFKISGSVNVCIPSTLLKRSSYKLPNILSSFKLSQETQEKLLSGSTNVLFIDTNSNDMLSYPLYQTIQKFVAHNKDLHLWYLFGGIESINKNSSMVEVESPVASPNDYKGEDSGSFATCCAAGPPTSLSGFQLPSSTPSNQKFLSSLKKNVPKLDIKSIIESEDLKGYNYTFKVPSSSKNLKNLPLWFKTILLDDRGEVNSNSKILKHLNAKFNKIEKVEQIRLNLAITDTTSNKADLENHTSFCSASTPCPQCDDINYKIPKGVEYGFKNRYNNVWPYEHSRVRLDHSPHPGATEATEGNEASFFEGVSFDDYFNGNYINYSKISDNSYIATQNPLPSTFKDFWKLIWSKKTKLIICLNTQSSLQPSYFNTQILDNFSVKEVEVKEYGTFIMKVIEVTKTLADHSAEMLTVHHLEFINWPDFGVPDIDTLIGFINFKNKLIETQNLGNGCLVHCSAGCGRTGCFIAIDSIIHLLKNYDGDSSQYPSATNYSNKENDSIKFDPFGDVDLVYKSIQFQRTQRISMCQNFDQFIVCYESVLKYLLDFVL
ncbi:tyrosine-protein phosphatase 2 [Yamadazyma tenuis]|uniref:protein-tyrosine-phosphatase n=1 Tax=Candida tenuis (strain ATCC 10573 / BCRC 21748 / CBS 615 / JCM 9827 / NBRC 10315 / NRRL Y-1498 / VKM Y-70) TaxID=590646 RepID=G3AZT5_CANTC|nr:phosphatases II [Yamadazyma tenuis ATCC 10573]EGV65237.1 phosphatases II [Yamadazyma tenuis ATCC 10573]WEJ95112.1 tyrosine-protein phosphatase 2 [Yamadazyma tenuis]